jgi:RES domain-containing protein
MELFRICKAEYANDLAASGVESRWNSRGQFVIYAGSTRSLATLESVVHMGGIFPSKTYKVVVISIPDDDKFVRHVHIRELPSNWRTMAAYPALQSIGSEWYAKRDTLLLKIPSVVIPQEYNYVVNTEHPDFKKNIKKTRLENYFWDHRLFPGPLGSSDK